MLDLWIAGATIVDGSGAPRYRASIGIDDGRIATIDRDPVASGSTPASTTIDGSGLAVAPGFIDVHNHSDMGPFVDPTMPSTIRQGVTTVVVGNCGSSPFPDSQARELASWVGGHPGAPVAGFDSFGEFLDRLESSRPAVHIAALIGHGSVRELALSLERRHPTDDELVDMRRAVAEAMDAGAVGLSTGLIYAPGMHADTSEIVALAREAARFGGIYASHIRGEGTHLFRALAEAIGIGRSAGLPVHVSHLKCETSHAWGQAGELLGRLHDADDATGDQYPYAAWASVLWSLLPPWAPVAELPRLLAERSTRARLTDAVERGEGDEFQSSVDGVGWDRIVIEATSDRSCAGLSVAAIADRRGVAPVEAFFELLVEDPATSCIGHAMRNDDVLTIMAEPDVMVASDATSMAVDGPMRGVPVHPRTYGTFPRVLGPAVRDGTLTLESAVRKMTSVPADRFGLAGRGRVLERARADLVLFDPIRVADRSTFERPHAYPDGIEAVVVEGIVAWRAGSDRIERAGRVLRRGGQAS